MLNQLVRNGAEDNRFDDCDKKYRSSIKVNEQCHVPGSVAGLAVEAWND
jgi:hypothetical protein